MKIASRKKDAAYFSALAQKLEEHQKFETIHVNPRLGTALISHTSSVAEIAQYAEKEGLFQLRTIEHSPQTIFQQVHKVVTGWSRALENVTGGRLDVPSLIFLILLVSGIYQVSRGNVRAPAWYTAFWYALGVFSKGYQGPGDLGNTSDLLMDVDGGE